MSKFRHAQALVGPPVALVQSAQQLADACAAIGVYPRHRAFPKWDLMDDAAGMTWELEVDGVTHWIVGINEQDTPIETVALIVHEAVHVWQGYAASLSETEPGAEFEAYSVQAITLELLKQYRIPRARSKKIGV